MTLISGLFYIMIGVFFIWLGSFQIITSMLPHDFAINVAETHGKWVRENVFKLPPIKEPS